MEIYNTEEQQAEAIKAWWQENGKAVILGAVLGLGGMFGWRAWNEHQTSQMEAGAQAYEAVIHQLDADKEKAFPAVADFIKQRAGSSYADLAAMQLAAAAVKAGKLDLAAEQLAVVAKSGSTDAVRPLAAVRLARVLAEQGKSDDALKQLDGVKDAAYKSTVAEVRGDVLLRKGDKAKALEAYQQAQAAAGDKAGPELQMKLDELTPPDAAAKDVKTNA